MPRLDPRLYQIAVLGCLLAAGLTWLDFDLTAAQVAVTIATAVVVQLGAARVARLPESGWSSALISSLSLCLLLRTTDLRLAACASAIAVGSKFVLRVGGKHVFNPTNFALVVAAARQPTPSGSRPASGATRRSSRSCSRASAGWW